MHINIINFIVQSWNIVLLIIRWIGGNISVGWLSFGVALLAFLRNNHKKLLQRFEYLSPTHNFKTTITVYNDSFGTEISRFMGILVTNKKSYCYRKILLPWMIKHTKYADKIFPYKAMVNIQKEEERQKTDFVAIKSHEMRPIVIEPKKFLDHVKQGLICNHRALKHFTNKKPIFIYFIYQTIGGKIKVFGLKVHYHDSIGRNLDIKSKNKTKVSKSDKTELSN